MRQPSCVLLGPRALGVESGVGDGAGDLRPDAAGDVKVSLAVGVKPRRGQEQRAHRTVSGHEGRADEGLKARAIRRQQARELLLNLFLALGVKDEPRPVAGDSLRNGTG